MSYDVYMHGQVLGTHIFLLKGEFVKPDEYSELRAKYFLPGGETGTAATVLASLGVSSKIDGTHIGTEVAPLLKEITLTQGEGSIFAAVTVSAQNPGLNPAYLAQAITRELPELTPDFVRVRRKELFDAEMNIFR